MSVSRPPLKEHSESFSQSCIRRVELSRAPRQDLPWSCSTDGEPRLPVVPLAVVWGNLEELVGEPRRLLTLKEIEDLFVVSGPSAAKIIRQRWNRGLRVLDKRSKDAWLARLRLDAMNRKHKETGARGIAKAVLDKYERATHTGRAAHRALPRVVPATCSWRRLPARTAGQ